MEDTGEGQEVDSYGMHGLYKDWRWTPQGSVGECKIQIGCTTSCHLVVNCEEGLTGKEVFRIQCDQFILRISGSRDGELLHQNHQHHYQANTTGVSSYIE